MAVNNIHMVISFLVENRYKHHYALSQFAYLLDVRSVRLRFISFTASRLLVLLTILGSYKVMCLL